MGDNFPVIADLGCGSGELARAALEQGIHFQKYIGCDLSPLMLENFYLQFPNSSELPKIELLAQDFDDFLLGATKIDLFLSSSALQWSRDLAWTLELLARQKSKVALFIFTSKTFKSLHAFLDSNSPLQSQENVEKLLFTFFEGTAQKLQKTLLFSDTQAFLAHLRGSGVMGGGVLDFKRAKRLLQYEGVLEYEGLLFIGESKLIIKD